MRGQRGPQAGICTGTCNSLVKCSNSLTVSSSTALTIQKTAPLSISFCPQSCYMFLPPRETNSKSTSIQTPTRMPKAGRPRQSTSTLTVNTLCPTSADSNVLTQTAQCGTQGAWPLCRGIPPGRDPAHTLVLLASGTALCLFIVPQKHTDVCATLCPP